MQLLAFAVGLALLPTRSRSHSATKNREQIEKLKDATWQQVAMLLGLSLVSLLVNGVMFWVALRPVHKLPVADVVSTNCIAAFLGYLPLKLGLILRIAIHVRRDRVPLLTVTAWFASVAMVMLGVVGALLLASLATKDLNALWFAIAGGGLVAAQCSLYWRSSLRAKRGLRVWTGCCVRCGCRCFRGLCSRSNIASSMRQRTAAGGPEGGVRHDRIAQWLISRCRLPGCRWRRGLSD